MLTLKFCTNVSKEKLCTIAKFQFQFFFPFFWPYQNFVSGWYRRLCPKKQTCEGYISLPLKSVYLAIATDKVSVCTSVKLVVTGSANSLLKTNQIVLKHF